MAISVHICAHTNGGFFSGLLGLEKSFLGTLAGVLWLASGAAIIAAARGLLGIVVPTLGWRPLAAAGAIPSLVLFVLLDLSIM